MKIRWAILAVGVASSMLLAGLAPFLITLIALPMGYGLPVNVNWWLHILLSILSICVFVWCFRTLRDYKKTISMHNTDEQIQRKLGQGDPTV